MRTKKLNIHALLDDPYFTRVLLVIQREQGIKHPSSTNHQIKSNLRIPMPNTMEPFIKAYTMMNAGVDKSEAIAYLLSEYVAEDKQ